MHGGRRAAAPIIFGEPEDVPVPGANTLESLDHQTDVASRKSKPIELLRYSYLLALNRGGEERVNDRAHGENGGEGA